VEEMSAQGIGGGEQFGGADVKSYPRRFGSDQANETNLLFDFFFRFSPVLDRITALSYPQRVQCILWSAPRGGIRS
jgi:hypothetical protein